MTQFSSCPLWLKLFPEGTSNKPIKRSQMRPKPRHYWRKSSSGGGTCRTVLRGPSGSAQGQNRVRRTSTECAAPALSKAEVLYSKMPGLKAQSHFNLIPGLKAGAPTLLQLGAESLELFSRGTCNKPIRRLKMRPKPRHYWRKSRSGRGACRTVLETRNLRRAFPFLWPSFVSFVSVLSVLSG